MASAREVVGHREARQVYTGTQQLQGTAPAGAVAPAQRLAILRGRRLAARRRRLVVHLRDWLGIALVAGVSVTLFAVTFFSLLGR
ncbi:MAG TPA: hypothetical protein VH498_01970 [Candidatus Dormibacteraeota bacterium]|nr:hypothetical protein [Candidatus Dormibacteraeota bacterium]